MHELAVQVAEELRGPMALLAGLARGRNARIADGTGREKLSRATAMTWPTPVILALTNQLAPAPMWHSAQVTRACGEWAWATACGSMTVWHTCPQNWTESV